MATTTISIDEYRRITGKKTRPSKYLAHLPKLAATKKTASKRKPNLTPFEEDEQAEFFRWVRGQKVNKVWIPGMEAQIPDLEFMYHPANGGARHVLVALHMQALGVRSGTPDVHWPLAKGGYSGFWLEFKRRKGGTVRKNQKKWRDWIIKKGGFYQIVKDWQTARDLTLWYYNL